VYSITYESNGTVEKWTTDGGGRYQRSENNSLVEERPFTPADQAWFELVQAAAATGGDVPFLTKIQTALTADAAYQTKVQNGTVSNADAIAHVAALNRQVQALIVYSQLRPQ
jgi:hypothetical protein